MRCSDSFTPSTQGMTAQLHLASKQANQHLHAGGICTPKFLYHNLLNFTKTDHLVTSHGKHIMPFSSYCDKPKYFFLSIMVELWNSLSSDVHNLNSFVITWIAPQVIVRVLYAFSWSWLSANLSVILSMMHFLHILMYVHLFLSFFLIVFF